MRIIQCRIQYQTVLFQEEEWIKLIRILSFSCEYSWFEQFIVAIWKINPK